MHLKPPDLTTHQRIQGRKIMNRMKLLAAGSSLIFALGGSVSVFAAECKPSKWGADDEIGAANYVTPKHVLDAVKLVEIRRITSARHRC